MHRVFAYRVERDLEMAGEWIKVRTNLWDDPRVSQLCDMTGQIEATIIGGLYWLWSSADQHTEDGNMPGLSIAAIDRKTGISGLGNGLIAIGWISESGKGVMLENFKEHNGSSAKNRCQTAIRVAKSRCNDITAKPSIDCNVESVTESNESATNALAREEKRREDIKTLESKTNTPRKKRVDVPFDARQWLLDRGATPQHADDWLKVRKEKKGANTLTAFEHVEREAVAAGLSIDQVAEMCARKPWCGFESKWVLEAAKSYGQGPPHGKPEKFDATQWVNRNRTNWEPQ